MDNPSSPGKRAGRRNLDEFPIQQTAKSTQNCEYDFEAQFQHERSDYDSENEDETDLSTGYQCSKELLELIQTRVKKFERLAKKHRDRERKRIAQSGNVIRDTNRGAGVSGLRGSSIRRGSKTHTDRSKSFVHGLSCGFSSFLSRPSKSNTEDEGFPVRLNRLHGADKSSMSVLSPTLRTEFLRMSYAKDRPRKNTEGGRRQTQSFSVPEWNSVDEYDHNHLGYRVPLDHYSTTAESEMIFQAVQKQPRAQASELEAAEFTDQNSKSAHTPSKATQGAEETGIRGESERFSPAALASAQPMCLAPIQGRLLDGASETQGSIVSEAPKWKLPVSISDLIQQYDAADPAGEGLKSQSNNTLPGSLRAELPFDIGRVRALFEQTADSGRDMLRSPWSAGHTVSSTDRRTPVRADTVGWLESNKIQNQHFEICVEGTAQSEGLPPPIEAGHVTGIVGNDVDGTSAMKRIASPSEAEKTRISSRVLTGEQSFISSITSSESPLHTPSSPKAISPGLERLSIGCSSEKEGYRLKVREQGQVVSDNGFDQETGLVFVHNRSGLSSKGERMNLGDLFDSLEVSSNVGGKPRAETAEKRREKVRFQPNDGSVELTREDRKASNSERRRRATSFVAGWRGAGLGSDVQGDASRRRTERLITREEKRVLGVIRDQGQRVKRRLGLIRNILSADDY